MNTFKSFNSYIQKSIVDNWDKDALTDYKGITLQYHDVARKIEKLHIIFEHSSVEKGDRIAICGRNSAHWAVAFFATLTYGAVAVPVLHEFNQEQINNIVNHSEAKLLFVGDIVAKTLQPEAMPSLEGVIYLPDFSIFSTRSEKLTYAREHLNELFGRRYPMSFRATDISYHEDQPEELALINYTSGTTGFSKGVMLPYRAIWGNLDFCLMRVGPHIKPGSNTLSILPMAHMYGMAIEFMFPFVHGCHLHFLNRLPSLALISQALVDVKPAIVSSVPLIVDKIVRKMIYPKVQNNIVRLLLSMPVVSKKVKERICQMARDAFGGNAYEVIVGGAPMNQETERFLYNIGFPITMVYGATECAPFVTASDWHDFKPGSCGTPVDHVEVKILSQDPEHVPGEIVARGTNVMLGYYKNEEATSHVLDKDGWYHTGDLATVAPDGHIYIRGRIKNLLLGSNGQNVYPEEIEDKLASLALVNECIVIQSGDKIIALVHPDYDEARTMGLSDEDIAGVMDQNLKELNEMLPHYERVAAIRIQRTEFEKTPKKSIKRYLYRDINN